MIPDVSTAGCQSACDSVACWQELPEKIKTVFKDKNWNLFPSCFYWRHGDTETVLRESDGTWWLLMTPGDSLTPDRCWTLSLTLPLRLRLHLLGAQVWSGHSAFFTFCLMFCSAGRPWFVSSCSKLYTLGIMSQPSWIQ